MALTKVSTGMLSADVASIDLNIDANTMYIDVSSNRVGINNATPSTALDVTGSVTASSTLTAQKLVSTDGILELDDNGTHNGIINSPASLIINIDSDANSTGEDFIISKDRTSTSGGTELFRVQEDGNVGIGTSSPYNNSKLDVLGSIISTSQTIGTYAANNAGFDFAAATKVGRFFSTSSDATGGHMTFITGAGGGNERMRIDASGNVGIGVVPENSSGTWRNLQFGGGNLAFRANGANDAMVGTGYLFKTNNSEVYKNTESASRLFFNNNLMIFEQAASGTAGNAISWSEAMRIGANGNVGIDVTNCVSSLTLGNPSADGTVDYTKGIVFTNTYTSTSDDWVQAAIVTTGSTTYNGNLIFATDGDGIKNNTTAGLTERMRIDSSGNLLVGKTAASFGTAGVAVFGSGEIDITNTNEAPLYLNRLGSDGVIQYFYKDGTNVGSIGAINDSLYIASPYSTDSGLRFSASIVHPCTTTGAPRDNAIDLGYSAGRFDDIYATNGTIQTSDRNEKQDIAELSDAEQRVAVAAKGLLRKFRWKDSVAEKGDEARTHFGIIAQDLQAAFAAEGLDAGDYAMFINSTWTDEETGEERSRMGVRYSELLAFIIAAI